MYEQHSERSSEQHNDIALEGEHQAPQQRQVVFNSYYRLSEWVAWAQPLAMNMRKGTMPGVTGEVMVVDYISGRE
jgi:hypothetical protein